MIRQKLIESECPLETLSSGMRGLLIWIGIRERAGGKKKD